VDLVTRAPQVLSERLRRPLRSPSFRRLALGKGISYLGDWLMVAVLVGWVYESTSSIAQVATLMAIRLVPPIIGGGLAASLVDRLPRQLVLVWSEVACATAVGGAFVGVLIGSRPIVFALVGLCGLVAMVSTVAGNALIPMAVEAEELPAANAIHGVGQEAAMALGAVVGGVTLAAGGVAAGLVANLASYAVAVLFFVRISVADHRTERKAAPHGAFIGGFRYVLTRSTLAVVVGSFALLTLATGLVNATLPSFTSGLGLGASGYGFALAALAAGMIVGETLTGAVASHVDARWLAPGLGAMGCLFLAFAWSQSILAALVLLAAFGVANGFAEVVMTTAIHENAEGEYHGRVFGVGSTLWRTTMLGAVVAAPAVHAVASSSEAITVAAVFLFVGAVAVATALRRGATLPTPAPA
jgi:MFS family permease